MIVENYESGSFVNGTGVHGFVMEAVGNGPGQFTNLGTWTVTSP